MEASVKEAFSELMVMAKEYAAANERRALIESWVELPKDERQVLTEVVEEIYEQVNEETAQKLFGKSYSQLSAQEKLSSQFSGGKKLLAGQILLDKMQGNPKLAGAAQILIPMVTAGQVLTSPAAQQVMNNMTRDAAATALVLGGAAKIIMDQLMDDIAQDPDGISIPVPKYGEPYEQRLFLEAQARGGEATVRYLEYQEIMTDTSGVNIKVMEPIYPPLDPYDKEANRLYLRAKTGDRDAIARYKQYILEKESDNTAKRVVEGTKVTPTYSKHMLERMSERGLTKGIVEKVIQRGKRYWNPDNKTYNYVLRNGANGKDILVAVKKNGERTTIMSRDPKKLNSTIKKLVQLED